MECFELNSQLRLLKSSLSSNSINLNRSKNFHTTSFTDSGKRLETLKSLRKLLKKFAPRNQSTILTVFDVLKSILNELTAIYFEQKFDQIVQQNQNPKIRSDSLAVPNSNIKNSTLKPSLRRTFSSENLFIEAIRRNEIVECIQILIDLISTDFTNHLNIRRDGNISPRKRVENSERKTIELIDQEEINGSGLLANIITLLGKSKFPNQSINQSIGIEKIFIPNFIGCLGHESSDVYRNCIRFLQLFIHHTSNLQKIMTIFIENGLCSKFISTRFGALNSLSHLFVHNEFKAENLRPLVESLSGLLITTQTDTPHLFYPTYMALERINSLIGSKRFAQYLSNCSDTSRAIFLNVQSKASIFRESNRSAM
ncbi:hypothetical protein QR98_0039200 [Sarcoptes scabiei]|uniref:Uncharacterized protein n=1 Tax=Sarcoptes scabiei TaxID=52283 RepID=A0A132A384_SARSC|nr:hypothetical protein QR98_0039200 [Sarcoptes scabiei]